MPFTGAACPACPHILQSMNTNHKDWQDEVLIDRSVESIAGFDGLDNIKWLRKLVFFGIQLADGICLERSFSLPFSFYLSWLCTQQIFRYPLVGYYTVQ